ncbi:hypothetical protein SAMN05216243_0267 [Sediminibacillus albus]|uniref:Uncharacterized protein n=1 Tax=Sediminibacillus albus TaxID=407036 RepID=A0A1G8VPV5_9BACI|nr:hypothetical protein SAMN05216243_0267 [Sediminibacillus albus]
MSNKSKDQQKKDRKNEEKKRTDYTDKKLGGPDRPSV